MEVAVAVTADAAREDLRNERRELFMARQA
jgi:hypothetical protein